MADGINDVESSVWGLLSVAETLWTHPDLATEEQEASCAVQKAKDLLQKARVCMVLGQAMKEGRERGVVCDLGYIS